MKRSFFILIFWNIVLLLFTHCNTTKHITESIETPVFIEQKPDITIVSDTVWLKEEMPKKITDPKNNFEQAYLELKAMLQGVQTPNFEYAVYLSESPYHDKQYTYDVFKQSIDQQIAIIEKLIQANDKSDSIDFDVKVGANGKFKLADMRFLPKEKKELYKKALSNWAIFIYITDTIFINIKYNDEKFQLEHLPFSYVAQDPFGKNNWANTQVSNLLFSEEAKGNCFALTALFKILSDRLQTDTRLCTAPQHVYIQHRDNKGDYYNIELATAGFPRDGTLQTLTHTTTDAIKSGIALRSYTEQQSMGLCMVNLAKSYEHYFDTQTDSFLLKCAETVLQYDSLNLSALLLKQQVLDESTVQYAKENNIHDINILRKNASIQNTIQQLEQHTALLYRLGYRQMPVDMQQIILSGNYPKEFKDKNPSPYTSTQIKDEKYSKYETLYGGLFKEVFEEQPTENYRHFIFDTKTKKLQSVNLNATDNELIDPVAFAYDFGARFYDARLGRFLSTDPLERNFPHWSPYSGMANNPILFIDENGESPKLGEIWWALNNLGKAKKVAKISGFPMYGSYRGSAQKTTNYLGLSALPGTQGNAFRHSLGIILSVREIGIESTHELANKHEANEVVNLQDLKNNRKEMSLFDRYVDLYNNTVAFEYATTKENELKTPNEIAKDMLNMIKDGKFKMVRENKDQTLTVISSFMADDEYKSALEKLNNLDKNLNLKLNDNKNNSGSSPANSHSDSNTKTP